MSRQTLEALQKSIDLLKTAGKDIHSDKWKRCVEHVKEQGSAENAYAVCTEQLGQESFKSFAKSDTLSEDEIRQINMAVLDKTCEQLQEMAKSVEAFEPVEVAVPDVADATLVTPTLDLLYGTPAMPRPGVAGEKLDDFNKVNW